MSDTFLAGVDFAGRFDDGHLDDGHLDDGGLENLPSGSVTGRPVTSAHVSVTAP